MQTAMPTQLPHRTVQTCCCYCYCCNLYAPVTFLNNTVCVIGTIWITIFCGMISACI